MQTLSGSDDGGRMVSAVGWNALCLELHSAAHSVEDFAYLYTRHFFRVSVRSWCGTIRGNTSFTNDHACGLECGGSALE